MYHAGMAIALALLACVLAAAAPASAAESVAGLLVPGTVGVGLTLPAHEWQYLDGSAPIDIVVSAYVKRRNGEELRVATTFIQAKYLIKPIAPSAPGKPGSGLLMLEGDEPRYLAAAISGRMDMAVLTRNPGEFEVGLRSPSTLNRITSGKRKTGPAVKNVARGLMPAGYRAMAVVLPVKTLRRLRKRSWVDVYAGPSGSRYLVARGIFVMDVRLPTPSIPAGTARLAGPPDTIQDVAFASLGGEELTLPARGEGQ